MTNIVFLLLAAIGLTLILKYAYILKAPRDWVTNKSDFLSHLFSCSQCLGFWSGLLVGFLTCLSQFNFEMSALLNCVLLGFASSFLSQVSDLVIGLMDEHLYSKSSQNSNKKLLNE